MSTLLRHHKSITTFSLFYWAGFSLFALHKKKSVTGPWVIIGYTFCITSVLVLICWWKGEPARWRWGDEE